MSGDTISINAMMARISDPNEPAFLIQFVRSSGKSKGKIKTVTHAVKGSPNPHKKTPDKVSQDTKEIQGRGRQDLHKYRGTLPMTDLETGRYFTPLVSHILRFNHYQVLH